MLYRENGQFKSTYAADQQLLPIAQDRWFVLGLIAFAYLAVPALASDYMFRALIIPFVILAIAAIGLNILVGYCGQISLGTAAFMAVGAYAAYNLMIRVRGTEVFGRAAAGGRHCGAGRRVVRHTEPAHQRACTWQWRHWPRSSLSTGCSRASSGSPTTRRRVRCRRRRSRFSAGPSTRLSTSTCSSLSIAIVLTLAAKNLVRGHIGRSWMATRDMDVAAEVIGIRPLPAKLSAFAVSSFYAGVAGALVGVCPPRRVGAIGVQYQPFA